MHVSFLFDVFSQNHSRDAVVWRDQAYSYGQLLGDVHYWRDRLCEQDLAPGSVISLEADFSPKAIALLLALIERECIVVPLTESIGAKKSEFIDVAQVETRIIIADDGHVLFWETGNAATHELLVKLKEASRPGLILFSSGSTGKSKAAVHDFVPLLEKFRVRRHSLRAIAFLLFDHIGGINTLFYTLSNAGCVVTVEDRKPDAVCRAIEAHRVELLPTSPTFINLLLLSEAYKRYDLSSLKMVTYGTEVMPESTLRRFHELFPSIRLQQTYGLSELGIMRSKSKSADSLWVKIGGEGFETRVVDGLLEVKAQSAMLGYLNAESPFTEDGWFRTGDAVEVDGEYFRILGRRSEMIVVGGEKVYPAEVESVLQLMDGVEEAVVSGEPNPITGQIVKAKVKLSTRESVSEFRQRMRLFCRDKLAGFKIPQKIVLADQEMHGERFKKVRSA